MDGVENPRIQILYNEYASLGQLRGVNEMKYNHPVGVDRLSDMMLIMISISLLILCCDNNSYQMMVRTLTTLIQISLSTEIWEAPNFINKN